MRIKSTYFPFLLKFVLLGMLSLQLSHRAIGQNVKFDYDEFNTKHGLSHNFVLSVAQDKRGFMWFGTEEGLNRFDGYEFKIYKHIENDPNSLISNSIRTLFVDEDGSIWVGTNNGVCRFYPETERIEHFPIDFTDETKLNGAYVSSIQKKEDGSTWISYIGSGVDIIRPGKDTIFHYTIHRQDQYQLKNDMVSAVQFMPDGTTLIGTYEGLQVLDQEGKVLTDEEAFQKLPWVKSIGKSIQKILLLRDHATLLVGTEFSGLYEINLNTHQVRNFHTGNSQFESNSILTIHEDSNGTIWVGSDAIYYFDQGIQNFVWYTGHGMYFKNHTHALYEDKEHNLWMGTARLGIRKINLSEGPVRHYHSNQGEGSIKSDEVLSFHQDEKEQLWVGTGGTGLFKMLPDQNKFEASPVNSQLISKTIKTIYKDKEGYFWMGTWDGGFSKYHPIDHTLEQFHPDLGNFKSRHVWAIEGDKEGNLWLGTLRDGLVYFKPTTGEYKYYQYIPGDSTALVNNDVLSLLVDSRNMLWVGTGNGLSVRFPDSDKFSNLFKFRSNEQYVLSNSVIYSLFEDSDGKIWLGTKGGGITVIKVEGRKLIVEKVLKETNGLPNNTITAIQEDFDKNVWVSYSNGLAKINIRDYSIEETTNIDGLQGTVFLPSSSFRAADGKLFFGGSNGFNMFQPKNLELIPENPEVWFTSLKIINDEILPKTPFKDRIVLEKAISETEDLVLTHEDYAFTINFSSLKYNRQRNIQYAYFLENLDKEWQYTNSERRFVHYTNLEPGKYKLKVKASFDGKHWPENAKTLNITVTPPWWSSMGFRITIALFMAILIYSGYKARVQFLETQRVKLEELVALRTSELKNSNQEIQSLLEEVALQKSKIELKNFELQEKNEEVVAQCDVLEEQSLELKLAQSKLREINTKLEVLVDKRTESLNNTLHELETFLYRASHDLKGPISSMLGLIAVAKMEKSPELFNEKYTQSLQISALKLDRTLHKLLEKYTIQKEEVTLDSFSGASVFQLLEETVTPGLQDFRKNDFKVSMEGNLNFETDQKLFTIIITNLLENAFFYSKKAENKKVELEIKQTSESIILKVTDFGPGIKTELKEKVFNMFYRGSELSTGNGLGLYLVKCAVEKLNGEVSIETVEGCFTCFHISLPTSIHNKKTTLSPSFSS